MLQGDQLAISSKEFGCSPKPNNELVGPQQAKEVVDKQILKLLVPVSVIVTAGIVSAASI